MVDRYQSIISDFEIYTGQSASDYLESHLPELKRLIVMESDATYHAPDIYCWRLRGLLQDILRRPLEWVGGCFSTVGSKKLLASFLYRLYPSIWFDGWTLQQERDWAWNDSLKLLRKSQFAIALAAGKLVGVSAYKLGGKTTDDRDIYEITKTIILPCYRKKGIHAPLRNAIIDLIKHRYGNPPMMSFTRNPSVIRCCRLLGWREISIEEYGALVNRIGRSGPQEELKAEFVKQNWRGFIFDPIDSKC